MTRGTKGNGSVRQKAPGTYQIRYITNEVNERGRHQERAENVRGTLRDANKLLRQRLDEVGKDKLISKSSRLLGEYLEDWIEIRMDLKARTKDGYREKAKYVYKYLAGLPVQQLKPQHIKQLHRQLGAQGLSNQSIQHVHRLLHAALEDTVGDLLTENIASHKTCKPPKVTTKPVKIWTAEETKRFFESGSDSQFMDALKLAYYTTMRRGELCGLRWPHVDFEHRTLHVLETSVRIRHQGIQTQTPKSDSGKRAIALGENAIQILHAIRGRQQLLASELGDTVGQEDYAITDELGKRLDPDRLSREFQRIRKIAGLPHLTLHGLRHTGNSYLLANGANIKLIAERMGHSDPNITLRIYSHILPAAHIEAADMLDRQLS